MGLSQFNNSGCEFDMLTAVDLGYFFSLLFMRLSWSHDLGYDFGELTQVEYGHFFVFFLIDFF